MAQIREIRLVDDLDGAVADETVEFGVDGKNYEIDLSTANAEKLRTRSPSSSRPRAVPVAGGAAGSAPAARGPAAVHRSGAEPGDPGMGARSGA